MAEAFGQLAASNQIDPEKGRDARMIYTIQTYLSIVAVAALLVGVMLLPAAVLLLIHEAVQEVRALPHEWHLTQSARPSTAPVAPARR